MLFDLLFESKIEDYYVYIDSLIILYNHYIFHKYRNRHRNPPYFNMKPIFLGGGFYQKKIMVS